jgi:hypothetical protein
LYKPPTTNLSIIQKREETDQVYTFLVALDPSYEAVRAQALLSKEKLTFDGVIALIRQEATRHSLPKNKNRLDINGSIRSNIIVMDPYNSIRQG